MNWYEVVPSLTPVLAYDGKSKITTVPTTDGNYFCPLYYSRLNDDVKFAAPLGFNTNFEAGGEYKYYMKSMSAETGDVSYTKMPGNGYITELGENWLIYYRIRPRASYSMFYVYYFEENKKIVYASFLYYGASKRFNVTNQFLPAPNNSMQTIYFDGGNIDNIPKSDFIDIAIQRSADPTKSFIFFNGRKTLVDAKFFPTKIKAPMTFWHAAGEQARIFKNTTVAAIGVFKGNADISEIPQLANALKTEINSLPDPKINIVEGLKGIKVGTRDPNIKPNIVVINEMLPLFGTGFSYSPNPIGKIEGTVHEVFPPDPKKPVKRRVICIDQTMNAVIAETWSKPDDGYYQFGGLDKSKKYTVLAYDHTGNFTAICCDNIAPQ